jgi:5-methylcytosine-specific restriction endonuclease McrA
MKEKAQIIKSICSALLAGDKQKAREIAQQDYPFIVPPSSKSALTDIKRTKIFIRDGFIDRYSGEQLVYPGAIILLSALLPEEFPSHPSWKMSESHIFYWELWPTIDHIVPRARGGTDEESNLACTSMVRNSAKSNWLLDEVGWQLRASGDFKEWDGLMHWFTEYLEKYPQLLETKEINKWHTTAKRCLPPS